MLTLNEVKAKSAGRIATLQQPLQLMASVLIDRCYSRGVWIVITQAYRTISEQNALYAKGRDANGKVIKPREVVTNARGGYSIHNFGYAFDFALLLRDGRTVSWDTLRDDDKDSIPDWDEVVIEAKKMGLEWGGDWRSFVDMPHLQWVQGLSTAQFRSGKRPSQASVQAAMQRIRDTEAVVIPTPIEETPAVAYTYFDGTTKKNTAFMYTQGANTVMYVQARDLADTLGVQAVWDNEEKQLTFNGRKIQDVKLIEGRTYLQLRPIAQSYGKKVLFDKAARKTGVL